MSEDTEKALSGLLLFVTAIVLFALAFSRIEDLQDRVDALENPTAEAEEAP